MVAHLRVQGEADVSNLGDLLLYSLDDLEDIAVEKGGIRILLDEKWRKLYRANTPRGVFISREMRGECVAGFMHERLWTARPACLGRIVRS